MNKYTITRTDPANFVWLAAIVGLFFIFMIPLGAIVSINKEETSRKNEFAVECSKIGGKTVYDGRQYVCLK